MLQEMKSSSFSVQIENNLVQRVKHTFHPQVSNVTLNHRSLQADSEKAEEEQSYDEYFTAMSMLKVPQLEQMLLHMTSD